MKHLLEVAGYEDKLKELAENIGNLRYDRVKEFLDFITKDILRQAEKDEARGKTQLSGKLKQTAEELNKSAQSMDTAWKICKPYMKDEM